MMFGFVCSFLEIAIMGTCGRAEARTAILYIPGGAFLTRAAGAFVSTAVELRHVAKIHSKTWDVFGQ